METAQEIDLVQMKAVDIHTVNRESLTDIRNVRVDGKLPRRQRFDDFLRQIRNPYCFRCGKMVVKISFSDTEATLEDRLEHYLATIQ